MSEKRGFACRYDCTFYPNNAMLVLMLSMDSCLFVTSRYCIEMAARLDLVFGTHMLPSTSTTLRLRVCISKNKGTSFCNFVPNSGLIKLGHVTFTVAKCHR